MKCSRLLSPGESSVVRATASAVTALKDAATAEDAIPVISFGVAKYSYCDWELVGIPVALWESNAVPTFLSKTIRGCFFNYSHVKGGTSQLLFRAFSSLTFNNDTLC